MQERSLGVNILYVENNIEVNLCCREINEASTVFNVS